ncbi:sigma-70 family RNA polymerase sigma factor [Herbivorax sp. ANBcel31]|uniref:RNA polymerase sigma factor n=1 Tax=Herbivorax sp. ANBcel31 TaxID=3069754 RepID=UPI0027B30A1C|nr:sigma-70 family RNA polymerase sigma factor [Herbivorax sp. ANBcel31]MDQ2087903.1 sigma-70 family RNA polymerase sigma factor [Herbivorax sp. ANBcel31]
MDINELVHASQSGDMTSFIQLLTQKQDTIYRIARTYTKNSYDAEDCISEASIRAFDRIKQLKNPEKFYVWYISILVNISRKQYKKVCRETEFIPNLHELTSTDIAKNTNNSILVDDILQFLNKNERDVLILRYLKDFKLEEIAHILGIPEGTIKSRLNRVTRKLKYGRFFYNET